MLGSENLSRSLGDKQQAGVKQIDNVSPFTDFKGQTKA
jgi:hypothetical protein